MRLHVSDDHYQGAPHFDIRVDGIEVASNRMTRAVHGDGQWGDVQLTGNFGADGPHKVAIHFTDDAYDGSVSTDKNLYIDYIEINGKRYEGEAAKNNAASGHEAFDPKAAVMASNGWVTFYTDSKAASASVANEDAVSAGGLGKTIVGTTANEVLHGTAGGDILRGFGGTDTLTGGAGKDLFVFNNPTSHDNAITDFTPGQDVLWVKGLMKGYTGSRPFADHILSISDSAAGAVISVDPDGNGGQGGHAVVTLQHVTADQLKIGHDYYWH
jgi:Ca2+-binding RTX toxin-like protein